jgi:hypothetical protein
MEVSSQLKSLRTRLHWVKSLQLSSLLPSLCRTHWAILSFCKFYKYDLESSRVQTLLSNCIPFHQLQIFRKMQSYFFGIKSLWNSQFSFSWVLKLRLFHS